MQPLPKGVCFAPVKGRHLLIALSGGADSVALTAMLADMRSALDLKLSAAHLDHGIRPESAGDAEWCRALCQELDIDYYTAREDVPAMSNRIGVGLESAARTLRYCFLITLQRDLGADFIALAHHMDDQAETVLMHLGRGAGPEGIGGMAEFSGVLYRPLLNLRKRDLTEYLTRRGLDWREDATNAVADNARNAMRLNVIPELEKTYPQAVPAISRYARSARIESDYVDRQAQAWLEANRTQGPYGEYVRLSGEVHPAILRRVIRLICGDISFERLDAVAALARVQRGSELISGHWRAERGHSGLYFIPAGMGVMRQTPLALEGRTSLPAICEIDARPAPLEPLRQDPLIQALDADALEGAILRTRLPGDRIRPLGCGNKLLSDYFIDRKVDRPLRDSIALVARGDEVLWVCGLGISEEAKLTAATRRAVALECRYLFDTDPLPMKPQEGAK